MHFVKQLQRISVISVYFKHEHINQPALHTIIRRCSDILIKIFARVLFRIIIHLEILSICVFVENLCSYILKMKIFLLFLITTIIKIQPNNKEISTINTDTPSCFSLSLSLFCSIIMPLIYFHCHCFRCALCIVKWKRQHQHHRWAPHPEKNSV